VAAQQLGAKVVEHRAHPGQGLQQQVFLE